MDKNVHPPMPTIGQVNVRLHKLELLVEQLITQNCSLQHQLDNYKQLQQVKWERQNQINTTPVQKSRATITIAKKKNQIPKPVTKAKCIFCTNDHHSRDCPLTPIVRRLCIDQQSRCVKCLEVGKHLLVVCPAPQCSKCCGSHHTLVCTTSVTDNETTSTATPKTTEPKKEEVKNIPLPSEKQQQALKLVTALSTIPELLPPLDPTPTISSTSQFKIPFILSGSKRTKQHSSGEQTQKKKKKTEAPPKTIYNEKTFDDHLDSLFK